MFFEGWSFVGGGKMAAAVCRLPPRFGEPRVTGVPRFRRPWCAWCRVAPGSTRAGLPWSALVL
eukprot:6236942-Lingulodinium_polyedra.AAC.1